MPGRQSSTQIQGVLELLPITLENIMVVAHYKTPSTSMVRLLTVWLHTGMPLDFQTSTAPTLRQTCWAVNDNLKVLSRTPRRSLATALKATILKMLNLTRWGGNHRWWETWVTNLMTLKMENYYTLMDVHTLWEGISVLKKYVLPKDREENITIWQIPMLSI